MLPEGWAKATVGEVFNVQLGKMLNKEAKGGLEQRPYLTNVNVRWGHIAVDSLNHMHFSKAEREKFRLKHGDLIICEGGEVGRSAIWRGEIEECYYQKALHRLRPLNGSVLADYMYLYMEFANTNGLLSDYSSRSSIAHLTREKLLTLPVKLPPLPEQRKIAEILSTWDRAIEVTQKLIANARAQKKALMQHLLTGKKRLPGFKGEWETLTLRNIASIAYGTSPKGIALDNGAVPIIGTGGVVGWTDQKTDDGPAIIIGRKGTIDKPQLVDGPFWAIDTAYFCKPNASHDLVWLFYNLQSLDFRALKKRPASPASRVKRYIRCR